MKNNLTDKPTKVFEGVIFDVYQWNQEMYDGSTEVFERLSRPDATVVLPVTSDGKILMSKQEQPSVDPFWGLFGGRLEEGEEPQPSAERELMEESGYECADIKLVDEYRPHSKIDWSIYYYIAKGCKKVSDQNLDAGEKIEVFEVDFEEFYEKMLNGTIRETGVKMWMMEAILDKSRGKEWLKDFILNN